MDPTACIAPSSVSRSLELPVSPHTRWAHIAAAVVLADEDVPTLEAWAARVHMSRRTLCNRCRAARARTKASLTLARLLRTLTIGDPFIWRPEATLSAVDPRTIDTMVSAAGLEGYRGGPRPPIAMLLTDPDSSIPLLARLTLGRVLGVLRTSQDDAAVTVLQTGPDAPSDAAVARIPTRSCA
jgi:hypothetical protein